MERINILADGQKVTTDDLPHYISENGICETVPSRDEQEPFPGVEEDEIMPWEFYEREIIKKALKKYGSYNAAGKALGLTHKTVAAKARKYHLENE